MFSKTSMYLRRTHVGPMSVGALSLIVLALASGLLTPASGAGLTPGMRAVRQAPAAIQTAVKLPGSDSGPVTATFGLGPAQSSGLDSRQFFNYVVTPNASLTDNVAILNIGEVPLTLRVYATDAFPGSDGTSDLLPANKKPSDAGSWFTIKNTDPSGNIDMVPRSKTVIPFAINVPPGASPGDHVAGVIASLTTNGKNPKGDVIQFEQRVAVRAFFRVSGTLVPKLAIEDLKVSYHGEPNPTTKGSVTVRYIVHNRGNARLGAHQLVDFGGLLGSKVKAHALVDVPALLPGGSLPVVVTLKGVFPEILGTVHVTLVPVPPPADSDPGLRNALATAHVFTIPWALLAVVLASLGWLLFRRRRKARRVVVGNPLDPPPSDYAAKRLAT